MNSLKDNKNDDLKIISNNDEEKVVYNNNLATYESNLKNIYIKDNVKFYFDTYATHSILTAEEEIALAKRIENGDKEAINELFCNNLKLVISRAKLFIGYTKTSNLTLMDLIQNGNLGLLKAIEKFDYQNGARFSSYATFWIDSMIRKAVINDGKLVRVPSNIVEEIRKIRILRNQYIETNFAIPTSLELYDYILDNGMDIDWKKFQSIMIAGEYYSLDNTIDEEKDTTFDMYIPDNHNLVENVLKDISINKAIESIFDIIRNSDMPNVERNINIFKLVNGLVDGENKSFAEIGRSYNLTRERVRKINNNIIEIIRQAIQYQSKKSDIGELDTLDTIIEAICQYADDIKTKNSSYTKKKTN